MRDKIREVAFADWIQLFAAVSILAGLGLVIWELKQSKDLAKAQLISDNYAMLASQREALMGENPALIIHKACVTPDQLTGADIEVLNAFFWNVLTPPIRIRRIGLATGIYEEEEWRRFYPNLMPVVAGLPYGRYWWQNIGVFIERFDPELVAYGEEFMAAHGNRNTCSSYPEGYLDSLTK